MLLRFTITNFRSFEGTQEFSLFPSGKIRKRSINCLQLAQYPKLQINPTAVLYGPNNSGKTNFIKAIRAVKWLVHQSAKFNSNDSIAANEFFAFNTQSQEKPTSFELQFIAPNEQQYIYAVSFSKKAIVSETLHSIAISKTGKTTTSAIFERTENESTKFGSSYKGKKNFNVEANQLLLSKGDNEGNELLKEVYRFFTSLEIWQLTETENTDFLTKKLANYLIENSDNKLTDLINKIVSNIDTSITGIKAITINKDAIRLPEELPQTLKDKVFEDLKNQLHTKHKVFDGDKQIDDILMPINEQSTGTRKLLGLLHLIITSLLEGKTLFIDEMNTSMHTEVTAWLIELFNNPDTNPNNAQLIVTTHDMALLDKHIFEKDQIYALTKDQKGASRMYSFIDFRWSDLKSEPRLLDFYETGRLGGVPHITKPYLESLIFDFLTNGNEK